MKFLILSLSLLIPHSLYSSCESPVESDLQSLSYLNNNEKNKLAKKKISLNIMILGDVGVGKSKLIHKFFKTGLHEPSPTNISLYSQSKTIFIKDKSIKLTLWEIGGGEFFFNLINESFLAYLDGFMIMGDRKYYPESIKNISKWEKKIKKYNLPVLKVQNKVNPPFSMKDSKTPTSYVDLDKNHFIEAAFERLIHMVLEEKEFSLRSN